MPAGPLFLLWRLKLVGRVRLARRRFRTLGGAISILVGGLILVGWVVSVVLRTSMVERTDEPPSTDVARLGLAAYLVFVSFSSLSFRGLYLPRAELERLLASPLSRPALVRYRMAGSLLTALPFTVIMALFLAPRFASLPSAALAVALVVPAATVYGQALSLFAARPGGWLASTFGRVPPVLLRVAGTLGIVALFAFLAFGPGLDATPGFDTTPRPSVRLPGGSALHPAIDTRGRIDAVAEAPLAAWLTFPLEPWARALTAPSLGAAAPWLGLIALLLVLMFEGVARMDVDYRDASLRTSSEVESKLQRIRSGQGGAGVFGTSRRASGWRVPWFFGTTPFGAVVWQRTTWLVRQARGTFFVVAAVAIIGVVLGTRVFDDEVVGPVTLGVLGVVYLASGIRADFRADLDRMESIKAWPLTPTRLFLATLLPGLVLTVVVVLGMLLARAVILDQYGPVLGWTALLVPFVAYVWIAVDNAVFLLFPVRFVPGQGSALQHTGRGFLLVMLRGVLLITTLAVAGGGCLALYFGLGGATAADPTLAIGAAVLWALATTAALLVGLTAFGAFALRRFDVSKVTASGA